MRAHQSRFGGECMFIEAARGAGLPVGALYGGAQAPRDWATPGASLGWDGFTLAVGRRDVTVMIDAERQAPWRWTIRVPVSARGTAANAARHVLRATHDLQLAPGLLAEGFAHEDLPPAFQVAGAIRAVWSKTVGNVEAAVAYVHAVSRLPTMADAGASEWQRTFGDLREIAVPAARLPSGVHVRELIPWGMRLAGPGGRELGFVDRRCGGWVYLYLAFHQGTRPRAARRRVGELSRWFDREHAGDWRSRGLGEATVDGLARLGGPSQGRWAIRLGLPLVGKDLTGALAAVAAEGVVEVEAPWKAGAT